jgi:hypothetical protein
MGSPQDHLFPETLIAVIHRKSDLAGDMLKVCFQMPRALKMRYSTVSVAGDRWTHPSSRIDEKLSTTLKKRLSNTHRNNNAAAAAGNWQ